MRTRRAATLGVATAIIWALLTPALAAGGQKPLTAAEMQALLSNGLTIAIMDLDGGKKYQGSVTIKADGTQTGSLVQTGKSPLR
jgi:hypothetical protein